MILIAAGFHGVSKRVQVALGSPPLGNRAGFHGISKRVQRGVGHLCGVKRACAVQLIRVFPSSRFPGSVLRRSLT